MKRKIMCKLGFHIHRVYGHCFDKEDQKYEYYYKCVFCPDSFWDYAIPYKIIPDNFTDITEYLKECERIA
jgi:hypothetical protein